VFTAWPIGPYPGTLDWLEDLRPRFRTALFSNTNALHERRMRDEMELLDALDTIFLSHRIGLAKPA